MKKYIAIIILLIAFTAYAFPPTPPAPNNITGNAATATALASNPTDCGANAVATAIDASGNLTCSQSIGTLATQNADNATITGGNVTGLTNLGAANLTVTSDTTLGTTNIGSTTAGKNLTVNATLGNEMAPALEAANWTATDGWSAGTGTLVKVAGTGAGTATPSGTFTVTAGVTYKVVMVVSAAANSPTYTLGGTLGTTITATTITDYVTAATTGKIIFSGAAGATCTITSLTVKALTDATGDATINGNIFANNQIFGNPQAFNLSSGVYPAYAFKSHRQTGFDVYDRTATSPIGFYSNGALIGWMNASYWLMNATYLSFNLQTSLYSDTNNTLALRASTAQQTMRVYNTYTSGTDYERMALTGLTGVSVNVKAETASNGADNLSVLLNPTGTGGAGVQSSTAGTGGGFVIKVAEAASASLSGASGSIAVNVPSGKRIVGVQLRVDTAITADTGVSWSAAYVNTPTTAICSGQAFTKNTKYSATHPAYEFTTDTVTITITPNAGTFTAGVIRAVVYYEDQVTLTDAS